MTRDKAIENIKLLMEIDSYPKDFADALLMAIEALSAEAVHGWIPVSERLPKVDEEVLVTMEWGDVLIAWYDKFGKWETDEWYDLDDILAWMPLPKPYREESEVEE